MTTKEKNLDYFINNLDEDDVLSMRRMIKSSHAWVFKIPEDAKEFMNEAPLQEWKQIGQGAWFLAFGWLHQQKENWKDPILGYEDFCKHYEEKLVKKDGVPFLAYALMVAGFNELLTQWEKEGMEIVR